MSVSFPEANAETTFAEAAFASTKKPNENEKVSDTFFLTRITFVFLGLMHLIPVTFFLTANSYWMEKFRNTSLEANTTTRTPLQSYFASSCVVAQTVPSLIFTLIGTLFGHKIKAVPRVFCSLLVQTAAFILVTGFVGVHTDSWQVGFFALTIATVATINGANVLYFSSILAIMSKFPQKYFKWFLIGEGIAGIFNGILQIFSLAVGSSTTASALIYFVTGSSVMTFTLILFYAVSKREHFRYYMALTEEDTKRKVATFSEIKEIAKSIWPSLVVPFFLFTSIQCAHPSVTALVVSESTGTLWGDKYFVPTVTFLLADTVSIFGRILSSSLTLHMSGWFQTILLFVFTVTMVPLMWLCNANPNQRNNLPVVFHHDWQYALILWSFTFGFGFFINQSMLNLNRYVPKEKLEMAYMVTMIGISIVGAITSPLGIFAVRLL